MIVCQWKFQPGRIVVTRTAVEVLLPEDMFSALARHLHGDWGEVDAEDWQANEVALEEGTRVLSAYHASSRTKFWIITEWNRSTTILLPSDY